MRKIQVTINEASPLYPLFKDAPRGSASRMAIELMELGRLAGSIERVISQTLREGLADLSVVAAPVEMPGDGVEDPAALAALGGFLGDIDDEEGDDI